MTSPYDVVQSWHSAILLGVKMENSEGQKGCVKISLQYSQNKFAILLLRNALHIFIVR